MTFIPGKDRELEQSISIMQDQLRELGFDVQPHSWLNPVPNVWSVHVRDQACPQLFTNGKGRSREAALASALGEFFERLATNYFFADFHLGEEFSATRFTHYPDERWFEPGHPELLDDAPLQDFYNAEGVLETASLHDINSANQGRGICALPFSRIDSDRTVWLPVNLLENLYASNGMSAGNTPEEARVQALSEIFERATRIRILREGLSLPDIPQSVVEAYPGIARSVAAIRDEGYELLLKDASLGGRYPVINVTLMNPEDGSCFASFGAHPLFEVALERTVTELLQGRALDSMKGFSQPSTDLEEVASVENLETHFIDASGLIHWRFFANDPDFEFVHWNFPGTTAEQYEHLIRLLHDEGRNVYLRDYTDMGFYACRIVVPGYSEIYPPEDLWYANNNTAVEVLDCLWSLPELNEDQLQRLSEWLDEAQLDDMTPLHELAGHRPDAGSYWNHLRLGELRLWTALAQGDRDAALDYLGWLQEIEALPGERRRQMQCLYHMLDLEIRGESLQKYRQSLEALYGKETVETARQCLGGQHAFHGINSPGQDPFHKALIDAYARAWTKRAAHG
jgi:ribosomal protein S12 methylthiotransferase accessory factor